jgi:hypothetical protein
MEQISVRWGDLGSPTEAGTYRCGPHMVEVTPGDMRLAEGNPDTAFTAIHPDFYMSDTPNLLTGGPASGRSAEPVDRQPSVSRWHSLRRLVSMTPQGGRGAR